MNSFTTTLTWCGSIKSNYGKQLHKAVGTLGRHPFRRYILYFCYLSSINFLLNSLIIGDSDCYLLRPHRFFWVTTSSVCEIIVAAVDRWLNRSFAQFIHPSIHPPLLYRKKSSSSSRNGYKYHWGSCYRWMGQRRPNKQKLCMATINYLSPMTMRLHLTNT